jgi:hypothetical protein
MIEKTMPNIERLPLYIDAIKHKFENETFTKDEAVYIAINFCNKSYTRPDGKGLKIFKDLDAPANDSANIGAILKSLMKFDHIFNFGDCSAEVFQKVVKRLNDLAKFLKGVNNKDRKNIKNHKLYVFVYYSGHGVISMEVDKDGKLKKDDKGK